MKKTLVTCIATASICCSFFALTTEIKSEPTTETNLYPKLLCVEFIDVETNICTATDRKGNQWDFVSDDAYINDLYAVIMDTKGTVEIEDDEIVNMRYVGDYSDYAMETVIDMETVVDYETTETGTMLHFADGSTFHIETN